MTSIADIEGIGPALAKRLKAEAISTVEDLLAQGAKPRGRMAIAKLTKIPEDRLLTFVNHADLFRIKGVAGEMAELLEAAGVDSVPELARRNAKNLAAALAEANATKKLVRGLPSEKVVAGWIAQAKDLPAAVFHH